MLGVCRVAGKTRVSRNGLSQVEKPTVLHRAQRLEKQVGVCWERSVGSMKSRDLWSPDCRLR